MENWLFRGAFALYALATGLAFAYLYSRNEKLAVWKYRFLSAGLALHAISFVALIRGFWLIPENRYFFPINSFFGALSWLAFANALVFFIVEGVARLRVLGAFVLPWTCLAAGAALFSKPDLAALTPALQSFRINLHPMLLMLAYSALANAFGVGIAFLIQERQIKSRKPSELSYRLPPLEDLDRIHAAIISYIFPVLTLGILMGSFWAYSAWTSFWNYFLHLRHSLKS